MRQGFLGQREFIATQIKEVEIKIVGQFKGVEIKMDGRFKEMEKKIDRVNEKVEGMDKKMRDYHTKHVTEYLAYQRMGSNLPRGIT